MKNINENKVKKDIFLAGMFLIVGLVFRLSIVAGKDFVLNDGGLFASMVDEIIQEDFHLPYFTSYNISNIPFAYPPLALYIAAAIVKFSGFSVISVLQYLPAIISSFTIPAVYFLGQTLNLSDRTSYLSTAIYTFIPRSWLWLVMGGGLTRSVGIFFAILAVSSCYRLFFNQEKSELKLVVLFTSLAILSHPEAGYFVVLTIVFIWLLFSRSLGGFLWLVLSGLGTLIMTSFWWLTVLLRHGTNPFWSAFGTGSDGLNFFRDFLLFGVTGEVNSHIVAALAIVGFFYLLNNKQVFLPYWMLLILMFIPRSGANFIMIPVSTMGAIAISEIILPIFEKGNVVSEEDKRVRLINNFTASTLSLIIYVFISILISSALHIYSDESVLKALGTDDQTGMEWVSNNTPLDSSFLILTQDSYVWNDYIGEWFPYISRRRSNTTVQGSEWLDRDTFNLRYSWNFLLKNCLGYNPGCLELIAKDNEIPFTHVYLPKGEDSQLVMDTIEDLKDNPNFQLIYDGQAASVFVYSP